MNKTELKPCKCGSKRISVEEDHHGRVYGCGIGCLEIFCEEPPVIRYAFTAKKALGKAINAWNRRATDERAD